MAYNTALKIALVEAGVSQNEVAERVGIHKSRLSKIMHGALMASEREMDGIARLLGKAVDELFPARVA